VVVSAPGKVILFGEHAVVHGKKAVASAIGLRTYCAVDTAGVEAGEVKLLLPDVFGDEHVLTWTTDQLQLAIQLVRRLGSEVTAGSDVEEETSVAERLLGHAYDVLEAADGQGEKCSSLSEEEAAEVRKLLHLGRIDRSSNTRIALMAFLSLYLGLFGGVRRSARAMTVTMASEIPLGAGLGSSAAMNVCFAAAMLQAVAYINNSEPESPGAAVTPMDSPAYAGPSQLAKTISSTAHRTNDWRQMSNDWAFQMEKIVHGPGASGIDNLISSTGGTVTLTKTPTPSGGLRTNCRFWDTTPRVDIMVTNTGVPRKTRDLIANVTHCLAQHPKAAGHMLNAIEEISNEFEEICESLGSGSISRDQFDTKMEELFTLNQHLLAGVGVSHPSLDQVCSKLRSDAGLHTKLTGAGGGGCAITFLPLLSESAAVAARLRAATDLVTSLPPFTDKPYQCFSAALGSPGATLHCSPEEVPLAQRAAIWPVS